jgi:hypothetical protein
MAYLVDVPPILMAKKLFFWIVLMIGIESKFIVLYILTGEVLKKKLCPIKMNIKAPIPINSREAQTPPDVFIVDLPLKVNIIVSPNKSNS